jgi:GNAT superfamily N-acetyltransferase
VTAVIEEVRDLDAAWPELAAMFLELHAYHEPLWPRRLRQSWEESWRSFMQAGDERLVLIARADGKAVGYMNARIERDNPIFDEAFVYLHDAYVAEEHRGVGLGTQMLALVEAWAREQGTALVRLSVAAGNELGGRFWRRSGYVPVSTRMQKQLAGPT